MKLESQNDKLKVFMLPFAESNPYQSKLCQSLEPHNVEVKGTSRQLFLFEILKFKPDVVHFHWLHVYFLGRSHIRGLIKLFTFLMQLFCLKIYGCKIVWTAHNLVNHEQQSLRVDYFATNLMTRLAAKIIVHSHSAKSKVLKSFPKLNASKISVIFHGNFIDDYQKDVSKDEARSVLSLSKNDFVILFLGQIREYKGVTDLITAFSSLPADNNFKLLIAGKPQTADLEKEIQDKINNNCNIIFSPSFIPDDDIATYFVAADIVALPYRDILTSGALIMAMGFGKPVIIPNIDSLVETAHPEASVVYSVRDITGLANAISQSAREKINKSGVLNHKLAMSYNWNKVSEMTMQAYRDAYST